MLNYETQMKGLSNIDEFNYETLMNLFRAGIDEGAGAEHLAPRGPDATGPRANLQRGPFLLTHVSIHSHPLEILSRSCCIRSSSEVRSSSPTCG